jgi:hypothetical protein
MQFIFPFEQSKVKKVKFSLYLTKHYDMKAYEGVDVWSHFFLPRH